MMEQCTNGFSICKDISEDCVWVASLEEFVEGFPNGATEEAIIREDDIVVFGFIRVLSGGGRESFVQESFNIV